MTLDTIEKEYIDRLRFNQNYGSNNNTVNLFDVAKYMSILDDVNSVVLDYPDFSLEEMREMLFYRSDILNLIYDLIYKKQYAENFVLNYGTACYSECITTKDTHENSLFDLASVTKLFTSISVLKLYSSGLISLDDKITKYLPIFKNLGDTTIRDLLTFSIPLKTDKRIDNASSEEEAYQILYDVKIDYNFDRINPYTDMGAMILRILVENITNMSMLDFINECVIELPNTCTIPINNKLTIPTNKTAYYYSESNFEIKKDPKKGIVFDEKARILGGNHGTLAGHAGLFSSINDLEVLARDIMNFKILPFDLTNKIGQNVTGDKYILNSSKKMYNYLGMLCFSKHPNQDDSLVPHFYSGNSIAISGWTGNRLIIDPRNSLYVSFLSNRSYDRCVYVAPELMDKIIIDSFGKKLIILPNKEEYIYTKDFCSVSDKVSLSAAELTVKYGYLEYIFNVRDNVQKQVKHL